MNQELNILENMIETTKEHSLQLSRDKEIKQIVEALLFSSSEALSLEKIREIINVSYPIRKRELEKLIDDLTHEYQTEQRAFQIDEIAGGYVLRTKPKMRPFLELLFQDRRGEKLSQAATEILAIVAYRGPISRKEIEKLRGVDCSGSVAALIERGLIESVGRKEAPGRPLLFATTKHFLQHFGLKDLNDLNL